MPRLRSVACLLPFAAPRKRRDRRPGNLSLPLALLALRLAARHGGHARRRFRRLVIGGEQLTVVDESGYALCAQRITELVSVNSEVGQRVTADGVEDSVGILRDHLDVAVKQYPVAWLRPVGVAQWVPALMCLRILEDRDDAE